VVNRGGAGLKRSPPDGTLILIAEIYKEARTTAARLAEQYAEQSGIALLSVDEHRELLVNAGYSEVQIIEKRAKGWSCGIGRKPKSSHCSALASG
jgi:hypothetical protein